MVIALLRHAKPFRKLNFRQIGSSNRGHLGFGFARRQLFSTESAGPQTSQSSFFSNFLWFTGISGVIGLAVYELGKVEETESTAAEPVDFSPLGYWKRAYGTTTGFFTSFKEPAFDKLLPDPLTDPAHARPYTLVVDLDKFLVCHMWDKEQGRWRVAKRPGAELFLFYASQYFEVVVFSSFPHHEADPVVKKLDQFGCISHGLYRFATKHENGVYLKDISRLNRDPAKVLIMGHDVAGFAPHPENMLKMEPWTGNPRDTTLEECVDFIEMLALSQLPDVRPAVQSYSSQVFPQAFHNSQSTVHEANRQSQLEAMKSRSSNFFFKLFGLANRTTSQTNNEALMSYADAKNRRIELRRKEYAHIRDMMLQQLRAEMEKEKEYYAQHKMPLWDIFAKGPPQPPPPSAVVEGLGEVRERSDAQK